MIISSPGVLRRSGVTPGTPTASRSTRMILSPAPTATMTISRRCLPRVCARSQSARRRRRPGSRPPWLLSKPRSLLGDGSAPDATNGTCRSVTCVTVATGSVPRRESSRAVSQTRRGTSRTATSLTPMTRRQSSCAGSRRDLEETVESSRSSAPQDQEGLRL